jgi:hypothetical protein
MASTSPTLDALELVENLDPEAIRGQLNELRRRDAALRVLLRAAEARERQLRREAAEEGGAHHA